MLKVEELAPMAAIESNPAWKAHYEQAHNVPVATNDDLEWADAIIFSVPTRFGNVPSQMKQFLDMTGGLWAHCMLSSIHHPLVSTLPLFAFLFCSACLASWYSMSK